MSGLFNILSSGQGPETYHPVFPPDPPDGSVVVPPAYDSGITLRPYQRQAVENILGEWNGHKDVDGNDIPPVQSTLLVLPTGTGKTVVISEIIRRRTAGRVMFIAHREELIHQGRTTIESVTGEEAEIEMASAYAGSADIVIATVQTLSRRRVEAFDANQFSLLIIDEAHHATAATYQKVHEYFKCNPGIKILGVTATPDRADEEALGKVFQTVAFDYELPDAIRDGWLVPIVSRAVYVEGLDYSSIRTTAGDLNGADLARVMEYEENLHRVASPTIELVGNRKALVFAASVAHAERLCEIFNRHKEGMARWVCGKTDKEDRRQMFKDYKRGAFSILVNVGVATEGFDEPSIEVIVMARPTKSRALFAQCCGRGTRALPGIVDGPPTPELRRAAIAGSGKTTCEIIDFVGNSGKHQLVSTADILGGNYEDDVIGQARANVEKAAGQPMDVSEALEEAKRQIAAEKEREAARRAKLTVRANYKTSGPIDPFKLLNVNQYRERGWEKGKPVTDKMRESLERQKLWQDGMTFATARQLIQGMAERRKKNLCTVRQAQLLSKNGLPATLTFDQARRAIDAIANNGWRLPAGYSVG